MAGIGLALTNVVLGLGNIGAGIGFGVAEQKKLDELRPSTNSQATCWTSYRKKSPLTSQFSKAEEAIKTLAQVLGYAGDAAGLGAGILQIVRYFRNKKAQGEEPPEPPEEPFEDVPLNGQEPPVIPEEESSFSRTPKLDKAINGLNIAGIVFGVAGLATTIGLGVWTLEKLNKAISDVESKQKQVTKFQTAMEKVLDEIVTAAELPAKSYSDLTTMAATWTEISQNFDSHEKALYYAIRGNFMGKPLADIKTMVAKYGDAGKPFPDDGYPLAKTLADDIKYEFNQKKTDQEVVSFFATDNPKIGLRFVFDEFFISSLRWYL
ncbi:hypothetical protein ACROYT_G000028 [Oculina patagonica]